MRELKFTFARSSGPGGQNVNKVNSKAFLKWAIEGSQAVSNPIKQRFRKKYSNRLTKRGEVVIQSDRFRDQGRNVSDCLEKLKKMLLNIASPPKKRKKTKPTRASREKRLKQKRHHSEKKRNRRTKY